MPGVGLWLAVAVAVFAPQAADADGIEHAGATVLAQLTLPSAVPAPAVRGLLVSGAEVTVPIVLDGTTLFRIGAPINPRVTQIPIATRVADVQTALEQIIAQEPGGGRTRTVFDPASLRVHIRRAGDTVVLQAVDAKHSDPLPILSVTYDDANANNEGGDALAAQWQSTLQSSLVRALELRQPAMQKRNERKVALVGAVLLAISLIIIGLLRTLRKHMERLEPQVAELSRAAATQPSTASEQAVAKRAQRAYVASSLRSIGPAQRLSLYGSVAEALRWALLLAWLFAVTWSLSRFADTTPLAQTIAQSAVGVVATVVGALLLNRLLDIMIEQIAAASRFRGRGTADHRARFLLRIPTSRGR